MSALWGFIAAVGLFVAVVGVVHFLRYHLQLPPR